MKNISELDVDFRRHLKDVYFDFDQVWEVNNECYRRWLMEYEIYYTRYDQINTIYLKII
jgi:hypothetical protein